MRYKILWLLLAVAIVLFQLYRVLHWSLPHSLEKKPLRVVGYISSVPITENYATKFTFKTSRIGKKAVTTKLQLSWYKKSRIPASAGMTTDPARSKGPKLTAGQQWVLYVKLKRPLSWRNPGSFDYAKYLLVHGIRASGYVITKADNGLISNQFYHYPISRYRQHLAKIIRRALKKAEFRGIITALSVGIRTGITPQQWQVFKATGTNHLVAISGLHIGLISGFIFLVLNLILKFIPLSFYFSRQFIAAAGALGAGIMYSALAGFSLPTQRAIIMLAVFTLLFLRKANFGSWQVWLWALIVIVLLNPLATLSSSFWLSFSAVAVLIYNFSNRILITENKTKKIYRNWFKAQFTMAVGLAVILLVVFQQFSLISFFANSVVIPWVGFLILPLVLTAILLSNFSFITAKLLFLAANKLLGIVWIYLNWLAEHKWLVWHHPITSPWVFIATTIAIVLLLAPRGFTGRYLGLIWLLPLFLFRPSVIKPGEIRFTVLDVGQGLATVVQTAHHLLIYDTGPKFSPTFNAGSAVVIPYLYTLYAKKINMLVVSHQDSDHSGGAKDILQTFPVQQFYTSAMKMFAAYHPHHCYAGQHWNWDGVKFRFLSPVKGSLWVDNNASCVLKITTANNSILLTGDIEKALEYNLVKRLKNKLLSTIVVAPHHGSNSSSSPSFVKATHPKYVIFSTGYLNRFHFPSPIVVARYRKIGSVTLDTVSTGAIIFTDGKRSTHISRRAHT